MDADDEDEGEGEREREKNIFCMTWVELGFGLGLLAIWTCTLFPSNLDLPEANDSLPLQS